MIEKQPWGITLNCILLAIGGILLIGGALVVGFLATFGAYFEELVGFMGLLAGGAVVMALLGVLYLVLAWTLWNRNVYAWWITLVLLVLSFASGIFALVTPMAWMSFAITILLLAGLLHKDTMDVIETGLEWKGWELTE